MNFLKKFCALYLKNYTAKFDHSDMVVAQVAHDIRAPLAVINMLIKNITNVSDRKINLIRCY